MMKENLAGQVATIRLLKSQPRTNSSANIHVGTNDLFISCRPYLLALKKSVKYDYYFTTIYLSLQGFNRTLN